MRQHLRQCSVALVICISVVSGCKSEEPRAAATAPAPAAPAPPPTQPVAAREPATLADVFPAGAGRSVVLDSCGSCHNVACAAMTGRPAARWDALRAAHAERVAPADLEAAFGYLKITFDESKPVPKIPAAFLEGGCTPF